MLCLGIESSCDETAVALYDTDRGLLGHALHSQIAKHRLHGGVVPELASRDHLVKLQPLLRQCLDEAGIELGNIDGVAYTMGPGLVGALLVGACFARSLAYALDKPALGVHHMEAHLLAPLLAPDLGMTFPCVALLVSGGHTMLVDVRARGCYTLLGQTLDDAAGEAFDKAAKMMGIAYPGGPELARLAAAGDPKRFTLPRPMLSRPGLDFSFSGLKTAVWQQWQALAQTEQDRLDLCASFQEAVVDTLVAKCKRALAQTGHQNLVVAGGVSANQALRQALAGMPVLYPPLSYCTDNGAMVALVGAWRLGLGQRSGLEVLVKPRWPLTDLV